MSATGQQQQQQQQQQKDIITVSPEEWERALATVSIDRDDVNNMIMNYLVIEGYQEAAQWFQEESGTPAGVDLSTISERMEIRASVEQGNIEAAIDKVNDLNPEVLDTNAELCFHLQQQRLIELIRSGKVKEALEFAQDELGPRGQYDPALLDDLERTMSLVVFHGATEIPVVNDLLDMSQRYKTASELNSAVLESLAQEKDPKLPVLLKMLLWAQEELASKMLFPKMRIVGGPAESSS
jgi:hypothetical protein